MIANLSERVDVLRVLMRKYGVLGLPKLIWTDVLFDYRSGTDTYAPVPKEALFEEGQRYDEQNRYVPSTFGIIREGLAAAEAAMGAQSYADSHFIDYGSGKGKVLIGAARGPFARIRGIEYSDELNKIAQANIVRLGLQDRLSSFQGDATQFSPEPEDRVLYFFNPFEGEILDATLRNITAVTPAGPRVLIVFNPVADDVYQRHFTKLREGTAMPGNARYALYTDKTGPGSVSGA